MESVFVHVHTYHTALPIGIHLFVVARLHTCLYTHCYPDRDCCIGNALELLGCDCVREVCITIYIRDGEKMVA